MARPIKPTPVLSEREADLFWEKVNTQLSVPLKAKAAPRNEKVIAAARENGFFKSK